MLCTKEDLMPFAPFYINKDFMVWSGIFVTPLREFKDREKLFVVKGLFGDEELKEC